MTEIREVEMESGSKGGPATPLYTRAGTNSATKRYIGSQQHIATEAGKKPQRRNKGSQQKFDTVTLLPCDVSLT